MGLVVFFVGVYLNRRFDFLKAYNIPEPVTGGLVAASVTFAIYLALDLEISFDLETRDRLLVILLYRDWPERKHLVDKHR